MATKTHFKERLDLSGNLNSFANHLKDFFHRFSLSFLPAIKVICKEVQTDHSYLKLKFGLSLCNWQLDCVQYTKLVSLAGNYTQPPPPKPHNWLKYFHSNFRTIDPTKIIITGKRVRFSFIGISDIIYFDPNQTNQAAAIANYQQVRFWNFLSNTITFGTDENHLFTRYFLNTIDFRRRI